MLTKTSLERWSGSVIISCHDTELWLVFRDYFPGLTFVGHGRTLARDATGDY